MSLQFKAAESQVFPDTNKLDDLRQDDVEPKTRLLERDADDEDQEHIKQNDTYELQETRDEALSSQAGGEEGGAENVETDSANIKDGKKKRKKRMKKEKQ